MLDRKDNQSNSEQTQQQSSLNINLHEWARSVASVTDGNVIEKVEYDEEFEYHRLNSNIGHEDRANRHAAKDDNNETVFHILVRKRRFDLVKYLLDQIPREQLSNILNIQNNQGNTILHLIFAEFKNSYNDKNESKLEHDFKYLFNLYPAHERYNAMFVIKNNNFETVFSMFPYSEWVHAIQIEILMQNLKDNINNYPILKIIDDVTNLFKQKYGTFNNERKQAFDQLKTLLLNFLCIYINNLHNLNDDIKNSAKKLLQIWNIVFEEIEHHLNSDEGLLPQDINTHIVDLQGTCHQIENKILNQPLIDSIEQDLNRIFIPKTNPIQYCYTQNSTGDSILHQILSSYNKLSSECQKKWLKKLELLMDELVEYEHLTTGSNLQLLYNLIIIKNKNGNTVLHLAAKYGHVNIIQIIISPLKESDRAAALNQPDNYGETVLHIAAESYPNKFDQFFVLYSPTYRFTAMTLKCNFGVSVFDLLEGSNINLLTEIFMAFTKIHRLLASNFHYDFMTIIDNLEEIYSKLRWCVKSSNAKKSIQLAFKYYDDCHTTNIVLFAKLYFILISIDKESICKKTMYRIKHALEGTIYDESKTENLDPLLMNEIEMRIIENKDSFVTSSGLLESRRKLITQLHYPHTSRSALIEIDEFVLSMLRACVDYPPDNALRDAKKYEILSCFKKMYNSLEKNFESTNLKQVFDNLREDCRKIADAIDEDHKKSQFSKVGTKSRLAKSIRKVLEKYEDKNEPTYITSGSSFFLASSDTGSYSTTDYFNPISPVPTMYPSMYPTMYPSMYPSFAHDAWRSTWHVMKQDKAKTQKIVNAFEIIYHILYAADNLSLLNTNFLSDTFKSKSFDEKLFSIDVSIEPMVCKAYKLAKEHCDQCDNSNYQLIFGIYEVADPTLYKTFTVSQRLINNIVTALNKENDKKMDKSDIVEEYSDIICHIKINALKKSDKFLDLGIFNTREQALNAVLDIGSESTERTKAFNRLDLFICNLLKIYVMYNPKKNPNRIENKAKLYTSLKSAYETCVNEQALTVDKIIEITDKLYDTCRTIAHDVDDDHQDKGPLAKVGKKSKFAKWITKELKAFKPEDFVDKKKLNHESSTRKQSNRHRLFELPEHLQADNNNEAADSTQYDNIIKFLKFKDTKTQEILTCLMQKAPSDLFADNSETTSERRKSVQITKFFATTQRDLEEKTAIIQSIVNHIKHKQVDLAFEGNLKDALTELKSHLESKIKELKGKSLRHHSETANDLEYFIKEMIDPKIASRINATDDASSYNKKYKARIPNFQL